MKKYKDLYEEEKQRHGEALQRYEEDHTDEMKIINVHKKGNKKARKVSQEKASGSDEPKRVSGPIDGPSEEEQKPKNVSSDGKRTTQKVKKTSLPKKAPKSPEFIDSGEESEEEEEPPQDDKKNKIPPLLGMNEEVQSIFDL